MKKPLLRILIAFLLAWNPVALRAEEHHCSKAGACCCDTMDHGMEAAGGSCEEGGDGGRPDSCGKCVCACTAAPMSKPMGGCQLARCEDSWDWGRPGTPGLAKLRDIMHPPEV
jgi:hypothetical protein